jgi:hypothetical protein
MGEREDAAAAEEAASKWPTAEYRVWVQSQIASRMFNRMARLTGGISLLTIAAVLTSLWAFGDRIRNSFNDDIETEVKASIEAEIGPITDDVTDTVEKSMQAEVYQTILDQSGLMQGTLSALQREIPEIVDSPEFQAAAISGMIDWLEQTDGVTRIIMNEAVERAKDPDAAGPARALGVELYALLSEGADDAAIRPEVTGQFIQILSEHSPEKPIHPQLLQSLVEHYPFLGSIAERGQHDAGAAQDRGIRCLGGTRHCSDPDDRNMLKAVLEVVVAEEALYANIRGDYLTFLQRAPGSLYGDIVAFAVARPDSALLGELVTGYASTRDMDLLREVVTRMPDLATSGDPSLRRLGLASLAAIDPFAELDRQIRQSTIERLWQDEALRREVADAGATPEALPVQSAGFGGQPEADPTPGLARTAILNMLRTGGRHQSKLFDDWDDIVTDRMMQDQDPLAYPLLLELWTARMAMDEEAEGGDPWAADQLLGTDLAIVAGDPAAVDAAVFAIRRASMPTIYRLANAIAGALREPAGKSAPSDGLWRMLHASVQRERTGEAGFVWLQEAIGAPPATEAAEELQLRDFVLASLGDGSSEPSKPDPASSLRVAAGYVKDLYEQPDPAMHAGGAIVLAEIARRFDAQRCEVWAAVEDSGLAQALEGGAFAQVTTQRGPLDQLQRRLDWIGHEPAVVPVSLTDGWEDRLALEDIDRPGGSWIRVDVAEDLLFSVSGDAAADTEIVAMDTGRTRRSNRMRLTANGGSMPLTQGSYAIGIRRCASAASASVPVFDFRAARQQQIAIGVNEREQPYPVEGPSTFAFDSGAATGDAWFQVNVSQGNALFVSTRADGAEPGADTYVEIFDPSATEPIAYNDDTTENTYSRLMHVATANGALHLRVSACCTNDFQPGSRFLVDMQVFGQQERVVAGRDRAGAPALMPGRRHLVGVDPAAQSYVGFTSTRDVLATFDPPIRALSTLDGGTVEMFGNPVDYRQTYYLLQGGVQYSAALLPGTSDLVTFRVHEMMPVVPPPEGAPVAPGPLASDRPALLRVPPEGGIVEVRGPAVQPVRVALRVAGGTGDILNLSVTPDGGGEPVLAELHSSGSDWYEGYVDLSASELYKIGIGPAEAGSPILAGLQLERCSDRSGVCLGDRVRLGRHTGPEAESSWAPEMERYVGCLARIARMGGDDASGQPVVYVDLNYAEAGRDWYWRAANLEPVEADEMQPPRCLAYAN